MRRESRGVNWVIYRRDGDGLIELKTAAMTWSLVWYTALHLKVFERRKFVIATNLSNLNLNKLEHTELSNIKDAPKMKRRLSKTENFDLFL